MEYNECKVLYELKKKKEPLISEVPLDEFTKMVQNNFDYTFTGESKFYPYELPKDMLNLDFNILAIVGASGRGKSTLLKEFVGDRGGIHLLRILTTTPKQSYLTLIHQKKQVIS